jgi:hypothetical protein
MQEAFPSAALWWPADPTLWHVAAYVAVGMVGLRLLDGRAPDTTVGYLLRWVASAVAVATLALAMITLFRR